jgi:hypothetical protein
MRRGTAAWAALLIASSMLALTAATAAAADGHGNGNDTRSGHDNQQSRGDENQQSRGDNHGDTRKSGGSPASAPAPTPAPAETSTPAPAPAAAAPTSPPTTAPAAAAPVAASSREPAPEPSAEQAPEPAAPSDDRSQPSPQAAAAAPAAAPAPPAPVRRTSAVAPRLGTSHPAAPGPVTPRRRRLGAASASSSAAAPCCLDARTQPAVTAPTLPSATVLPPRARAHAPATPVVLGGVAGAEHTPVGLAPVRLPNTGASTRAVAAPLRPPIGRHGGLLAATIPSTAIPLWLIGLTALEVAGLAALTARSSGRFPQSG